MHFKIIVSLVTLLLSNFALAAPAPTNTRIELPPLSYFLSSNRTSSSNSPLAKREYDCDNYSAEDNTSSGSPTVNDCLQIMYNIQGGGS
jgi:hypothetical protein